SIGAPEDPCSSCDFIQGTGHKPYAGGQCNVFALKDHLDRCVATRVFLQPGPSSVFILLKELKCRREIKRRKIKFFQDVISSSETGNQLIRNPFICLSWAEGEPLIWSDCVPEARSNRNNLIKKIANICLDLMSIREKCTSAKDEVMVKIQRKIERAEKGSYSGVNVQSCKKQMSLLERYWIPHLDNEQRVLVHGDLSANNIIMDQHSNLKRLPLADNQSVYDFANLDSILDLGWAEMVPLQFAATYPRFLTHEPQSHGTFDWVTTNTDCMQKDRLVFRECVRERAIHEGGFCQVYHDILCRDDEVNRYWWFIAISEADKHMAMESCNWNPEPPKCYAIRWP
ncbi:unnamed protein product, partial [Aureobasidium pullulans]